MTSVRMPDLSERPHKLEAERVVHVPASAIYDAWTKRFDVWFAAPGSASMHAEVGAPFFFETEHKFEESKPARRHPHYGRFLQLVPNSVVKLAWVTGAGGTEGAETVVTVELEANGDRTSLRLSHEGFPNEAARDRHQHAWRIVLENLEKKLVSERTG